MKLLYVHAPKTNLELIDFFIDQVKAVEEEDYGDCMREWNRELLFLRSHLKDAPTWMYQSLNEMQGYIQFYPNWDVESTRAQILEDADHLRYALLSEAVEKGTPIENEPRPGLLETSDALISSFSF